MYGGLRLAAVTYEPTLLIGQFLGQDGVPSSLFERTRPSPASKSIREVCRALRFYHGAN